ncbi:CotG/ExsB N-terminal domain-containing protein [Bacillus velezensis]
MNAISVKEIEHGVAVAEREGLGEYLYQEPVSKNVRAVPAAENGVITGHTAPAAEDGVITGHTAPAAEDGAITGHTAPAAEDGAITGHTVHAADGPIKNVPASAVLNADCRLYYK